MVNPRLLSRFQIGAYDQQIWEKSVEQREIKVRRFWAQFGSGPSLVLAALSHLPSRVLLIPVFSPCHFSCVSVTAVFVLSFSLFPV